MSGWGWGWAGPHLPQLLAHQGAEPEVDEALAARGPGLEVHHEHVGEEAEEGEVGQDVQVEDNHGRAEEGADAGQAPLGLQPPVPGADTGRGAAVRRLTATQATAQRREAWDPHVAAAPARVASAGAQPDGPTRGPQRALGFLSGCNKILRPRWWCGQGGARPPAGTGGQQVSARGGPPPSVVPLRPGISGSGEDPRERVLGMEGPDPRAPSPGPHPQPGRHLKEMRPV